MTRDEFLTDEMLESTVRVTAALELFTRVLPSDFALASGGLAKEPFLNALMEWLRESDQRYDMEHLTLRELVHACRELVAWIAAEPPETKH